MAETRDGIFAGDDPFTLACAWLAEAERSEPEDPNAIALATCDEGGMPNVRMVLLKEIEAPGPDGGFLFYTNYEGAKGLELAANPQAAFTMHWKSLRRQVRARGPVERVEAAKADAYYASRGYDSRIGAWASRQSRPLESREALLAATAEVAREYPADPPRPPHWGGFRIRPVEMEFWADGAHRLHDRFRWTRESVTASDWSVTRLNP
jgi:pyridoxamine 5'-phosphate oxidase